VIVLSEAAILEMKGGEPEPELNDETFTIYMPYAKPGRRPHKNSLYIKGLVASAEKMGKTPNDFTGGFVTLERIPVDLGFHLEGEEENVVVDGWCYAEDEGGSAGNIVDHVRELVVGTKKAAAVRNLMMDARAKQYPEYKDALDNGTLAELLGLEVVDGVFTLTS